MVGALAAGALPLRDRGPAVRGGSRAADHAHAPVRPGAGRRRRGLERSPRATPPPSGRRPALGNPVRRVTFSRNYTLSLSRTCRATASTAPSRPTGRTSTRPEEVERRLDDAVAPQRQGAAGPHRRAPGGQPRGRRAAAPYGHDDFTSYVVWACERALERGLLPHTNLGVLGRTRPRPPARGHRLAGADAGVGLRAADGHGPRRLADQAPRRRLETIEAAGELRIPFTSGILVGIGETEDERIASLEALAGVAPRRGHLQEVILQNFVPHPRYYGPRGGGDRRRGCSERWGRSGERHRLGCAWARRGPRLPDLGDADHARGHEAAGRASAGG